MGKGFFVTVLVVLVFTTHSNAATYYLDKESRGGTCNDSNSGTLSQPWCTIGKANSVLQPGDTAYLRGGTYYETIRPAVSGAEGKYITYRNYSQETANIDMQEYELYSRTKIAVDLRNRSYIAIEGLTLTNAKYIIRTDNSHHCIIKNNILTRMNAGIINFGAGSNGPTQYYKILDNHFEALTLEEMNIVEGPETPETGTGIWFKDSDDGYNLIEGNEILMSGNYGIVSENNYNVIRNNHIHHCGDKGISVFKFTRHTVVENNVFHHPSVGPDGNGNNLTLYSGTHTILRNNILYDDWQGAGNLGESTLLGSWSKSAIGNSEQSRIYNNVIYGSDNWGISLGHSPGSYYTRNLHYKNNIIYKNRDRYQIYFYSYKDNPVWPPYESILFDNNLISTGTNGQKVVSFFCQGTSFTIAEIESSYPDVFMNNVEGDPEFVNEAERDFHLQSTSPMINAGAFLTKTTAAGSGTTIAVKDASYFYDGWGIPGEQGDLIQLEGQTQIARITSIDYDNNRITVDRSLTWSAGQGVSLPYKGSAPDIGAFEYGASILYGDVSENGQISAYDASLTAQHAVGITTLTPEQQTKADVSGDGGISAYDASWIARKVVDESVVFPVEE